MATQTAPLVSEGLTAATRPGRMAARSRRFRREIPMTTWTKTGFPSGWAVGLRRHKERALHEPARMGTRRDGAGQRAHGGRERTRSVRPIAGRGVHARDGTHEG